MDPKIKALIDCINEKRTQEGDDWIDWESPPDEWHRVEQVALAAEAILRTNYFCQKTCTGFNFAVWVYNEVSESRLPTY